MVDAQNSKKVKGKKKDEDNVGKLTSALQALSLDQQVATLLGKYAELLDENRKLQNGLKDAERRAEAADKEKEMIVAEHSKTVLTRARLESLCRELHKQNKIIKDENLSRLKEEEDKRKEVSSKFNTTLSEISSLMRENSDKNSKLRVENQKMANRLQDLIKQYDAREEHTENLLKQKDLQFQLAEANLAKFHIEATEEKEKLLTEKKNLLEDLAESQHKLTQLSMTEVGLRSQLNSYVEKYEEFQNTLDKSNDLFQTFKKEMDEMTKKIKNLEKETRSWKKRWEDANKNLLEMATERESFLEQIETQKKQNNQLSSLCRALQQQLVETRAELKSFKNLEKKTSPEEDPSTAVGSVEYANRMPVVNDGVQLVDEVLNEQKECYGTLNEESHEKLSEESHHPEMLNEECHCPEVMNDKSHCPEILSEENMCPKMLNEETL